MKSAHAVPNQPACSSTFVKRSQTALAHLVCLMAANTCGSGLQEIPRGPHPTSGVVRPIVVDSAPPPAVIETINPPPDSDCLWADGFWSFRDNEWVWERGAWVRLNTECYYAESSLVWVPAVNQPGALFFTPGQWYHSSTGTVCTRPADCRSSSNSP